MGHASPSPPRCSQPFTACSEKVLPTKISAPITSTAVIRTKWFADSSIALRPLAARFKLLPPRDQFLSRHFKRPSTTSPPPSASLRCRDPFLCAAYFTLLARPRARPPHGYTPVPLQRTDGNRPLSTGSRKGR